MRTVVHLSDMHFGRVDQRLLAPLRARIEALRPHVIVVSGDLTQRAKPHEFREARAYLDTLPKPQVVVPGNHDVPLYNVFQRFLSPLGKYRRIISEELEPSFIDDEVAVVGVNTARSLVFKGGRINEEQVKRVRGLICDLDDRMTKIVVSHHPFDMPDDWDDQHQVVGRAAMALRTLAKCGADVLLSGHMHKGHIGQTAETFKAGGTCALLVAAGTATSTRARGEANSFNALTIEPRHIEVQQFDWNEAAGEFAPGPRHSFDHGAEGWTASN
ncbi:MAG TPA: metallophosphoesterase [Usitatibacter sp.]|nr:metallophosphoesterase [Usitatibacter sp.]